MARFGRGFALAAAMCATLLASSTSARAGRVVESQDGQRTVVRVTAPRPAVGVYLDRFAVAVGGPGSSLRVLSMKTRRVADEPLRRAPIDHVEMGALSRVRHTLLRPVEVPRFVRDASGGWAEIEEVVLAVDHPQLSSYLSSLAAVDAASDLEVLRSSVTNSRFYAQQLGAVAARPERRQERRAPIEDTFSRSEHWIRLEVDRGGIHRLDPADLRAAIGSDVDLIDPSTLRLFAAPTYRADPDVEDPQSSWREGYALRERALHLEVAGSTLAAGDAIWFFTAGPHDWRDRYDASANMWDFDDRLTTDRTALWLTYDEIATSTPSTFATAPARMALVDATPTGTARVVTDARSRLHFEQNDVQAFGRLQDNWAWRDRIETTGVFRNFFDLPHARTDSAGWLESTPAMDPPARQSGITPTFEVQVRWNSALVGSWLWTVNQQSSLTTGPVRFRLDQMPVADGLNDLSLTNVSAANGVGSAPEMIVDYYSVAYRRWLELDGPGLTWILPAPEAALSPRFEFRLTDQGNGLGEAVVLDTTDPWNPTWLAGSVTNGGAALAVETSVAPGGARFAASFRSSANRPVVLRRDRPRRLREEVSAAANGGQRVGWDMVILHPALLAGAAEDLAAYRRQELEGSAGARVTTVDLQDVYDEFGPGTKDPGSIRNYLKFLFDTDPRLRYVVLMGDGSRDARGIIENGDRDLCPVFIQTHWPLNSRYDDFKVPYARDDFFVCFDPAPVQQFAVDIDTPDVPIGRIPATTPSEARIMVQRIIDAESAPTPGTWRNTVLMAADDEVGLAGPIYRETDHINQAEFVRQNFLPRALDVDQLYLTEFPTVPGSRGKPTARQQLRSRWSQGRLIVHYIGHGSPEQLADENLFRIEDVSSLTNATKRPLFVAFSCDVSIFDDPIKRSMSEQLVLSNEGGAIATVAATQVTFIGPNNVITNAFYQDLFASPVLDRSTPIGKAIWQAKVDTFGGSILSHHNGSKYVVLGDPALRLQTATESLVLSGRLATVIRSGQLADLTVDSGSSPASGHWYLMAEESADSVSYLMDEQAPRIPASFLDYELVGKPFFVGEGQFSGGRLVTQLRTPSFLNFGNRGRVRVIFEESGRQFVGVADSLLVERGVPDTADDAGPTIELSFANAARRVTPGMTLSASIADSSGINVLGTVPANSILLEFDDSGVQTDVTDLFVLDEDDFTRGTLSLPLPGSIEAGPHRLVLSAGDMMSNVSTASIDFEVVADGIEDIGRHTPFPNPFRRQTSFVVEVIAPAGTSSRIQLTVYTLDGQRVRTLQERLGGGGGRVSIPWDGRDQRGGEIANGTYLYTVKVDFEGTRPTSQTDTGRVVLMR